jgi:hypothetical protein
MNPIFFRQVGLNLIVPGGVKTIDATGKLVMPGISCIFIYLFFTYIKYSRRY